MEMGRKFFGSYYDMLRVGHDSSAAEIRRAYRRLAMKWHPDRWTKKPSMFREAKRNFQIIREAYEVLSDERKRMMYDAGLYDPNEEDDEGFCEFVGEMLHLMAQSRSEKQNNSLEDLQGMLMEMAQGFDLPPSTLDYSMPMDSNFIAGGGGRGGGPHVIRTSHRNEQMLNETWL